MSEKTAVRTREKWVDGVKVIACILVVLGHFFQSMTKANILPENDLYEWFNTTIYYFHVPLFFICSGYLYQKYSKVNSVGSWYRNVAKKSAGTRRTICNFYDCYMGTEKSVLKQCQRPNRRSRRNIVLSSNSTVLVSVCIVLHFSCYADF